MKQKSSDINSILWAATEHLLICLIPVAEGSLSSCPQPNSISASAAFGYCFLFFCSALPGKV